MKEPGIVTALKRTPDEYMDINDRKLKVWLLGCERNGTEPGTRNEAERALDAIQRHHMAVDWSESQNGFYCTFWRRPEDMTGTLEHFRYLEIGPACDTVIEAVERAVALLEEHTC